MILLYTYLALGVLTAASELVLNHPDYYWFGPLDILSGLIVVVLFWPVFAWEYIRDK